MFADETKRLWKDVLLILASGAFLAAHFACWVWVSATVFLPIMIVHWAWRSSWMLQRRINVLLFYNCCWYRYSIP